MSEAMERALEQGRPVVRLAGAFDSSLAWRLRDELMASSDAEVVLDFGAVRELSELALAVLANGIVSRQAHVLFRGLSRRHVRLLEYCGVVTGGQLPVRVHR